MNGNSYYYHQDELNSVEAITNNAGALTEKYKYDPYGKPAIYNAANTVIPSSIAGNRFGFTGQEYDSANGNNHFYFRNYDPESGTFNQRDLIGYADGTGMYQYVHNNPANGVDIFGLDDCDPTPDPGPTPDKRTGWQKFKGGLNWTQWWLSNGFSNVNSVTTIMENNHIVNVIGNGSLRATQFAGKFVKFMNSAGMSALLGPVNAIAAYQSAQDLGANWDSRGAGANTDAAIGLVGNSTFAGISATSTINGISSYAAGGGFVNGFTATLTGTAAGTVVVATAGGLAIYGVTNETVRFFSGKSIAEHGEEMEIPLYTGTIRWLSGGNYYPDPPPSRDTHWKPRIIDCPNNNNPGGPRRRKYWVFDENGDSTEVITSNDPNLIIGPDGQPAKKWVSVNDRLPYTILYENARSASAPAKYVKAITPIEPKQDPNTFQLGSFGFNNQTFTVPPATASYYQRLDCIDSLGLYVDLTAGYDQINNQAFWEFQAIDPATLLPPTNPLVGFLLLQDSSKPLLGHGFVNFSIKPVQTAVTLDTIGARAKIVFDSNDTIPTNIAKNTIDAFPPVSHMNSNPAVVDTTTVRLSWHGTDDLNGVGVKYYSLYVSVNGGAYSLYRSQIYDTSINFKGLRDSTYCFFTTATDSVGNTEPLKLTCDLSVTIPPTGPLPLTWLYFNGVKKDKDVLLRWATGSEINTKNFVVERSYNGSTFAAIGTVNAMGFSTVTTNYSFTDTGALGLPVNVLYYRLKQVDRDGKNSYSIVVTIRLDRNTTDPVITVYPNPFSQSITLKVIAGSSVDKTNSIDLYTVQGKLVYHKTIDRQGNVTAVLNDLPFLTSGVYLLKTSVNGNEYTFKILKQ